MFLNPTPGSRRSRFAHVVEPAKEFSVRMKECGHEFGYKCGCHVLSDRHEDEDLVEHFSRPFGRRIIEE